SETPLHLAVYRATGAQAVIHVHPPTIVAFSLANDRFVPVSWEERYILGEIAVVPQSTPTVKDPAKVVEALQVRPVVILKGHGTVAMGKDLRDAFLLTDLLEGAVHCQFLKEGMATAETPPRAEAEEREVKPPAAKSLP
ncbi:MAG TPA: class II aldolase/adducin family protein, partial [Candidatus Binatia bacterium]